MEKSLYDGLYRIRLCEHIKELFKKASYEEYLTEKEKNIIRQFEDLQDSSYLGSTIASFFETLESIIDFIKEN